MNPKAHYLTVFLFVLFTNLQGQSESFRYAIPGSDGNVTQFEVDSVGNNYIVGGYNDKFIYQDYAITGNPQSEGDLFLLKTTPSGKPVYLHSLNGTGNGDAVFLRKFEVKQSGEIYLVLGTNGISELILGNQTLNLDDTRNSTVVAKFTKSGFLEWTNVLFAEGSSPSLTANDIDVDAEGNVFIAGEFTGINANLDGVSLPGIDDASKIFLVKFMADGTIGWGSTCGHTTDTVGDIFANDIEVSPEGLIYLSGYHTGGRQFIFDKDIISNRGTTNAYLSGFSPDGTALWAIPFEGDGTILPADISINKEGKVAFSCYYKSGSLIVNGQTFISIDNFDLLIINVSNDKTFNWETGYFTTNLSLVSTNSAQNVIRFGNNGNLYVSGKANNGSDFIYFYSISSETGNVMTGMNSTVGANANYDHLKIDEFGNSVVAGNIYNTFEIDGYLVEESTGYGTSYLLRVNGSGRVDYVYQRPNTLDDNLYFRGIGVDRYNNLFVGGDYSGIDVKLEQHLLSAENNSGIFVAEYSTIGSISGKVQDVYSTSVNGMVKLYGYTTRQKSPVADSVEIMDNGAFQFHNVPLGKYILLVVPDNSNGTQYMETYFPINGEWESAGHVIIEPENLYQTNVFIIVPETDINGASRLSGNITEIEEDDVFKSTQKKPRARSKAKLAKSKTKSSTKNAVGEGSGYQIIAETESDDEGNFQFYNVPDDEYVILIDIPGLPNIDPHSVTVSNGQFISNINYYVDEETVTGIDNPNSIVTLGEDDKSEILAYPNPTQDKFYIESLASSVIDNVIIRDIQGRTVTEFINIDSKLEVSDLESGIYLVQVISNSKNFNFKLIVNR